MSGRAEILGLLLFATGCAGQVHVERVVRPAEVDSYRVGTLREVALVRGNQESPLAENAHIRNGALETAGDPAIVTVPLAEDDVLEADGAGRIVAVRRANGTTVRFVPGTASSPEGADVVRGMPLGAKKGEALTLSAADRVRMAGDLTGGEVLPDGTRAVSKRFAFGLVAGSIVFSLAYLPAFIVGVTSDKKYDRTLMAPLLGPWINLANRPGCGAQPTEGTEATVRAYAECEVQERASKILLPVSGILQGAGALLFVIGLPESVTLEENSSAPKRARFRVVPMGGESPGLVMFGTF